MFTCSSGVLQGLMGWWLWSVLSQTAAPWEEKKLPLSIAADSKVTHGRAHYGKEGGKECSAHKYTVLLLREQVSK